MKSYMIRTKLNFPHEGGNFRGRRNIIGNIILCSMMFFLRSYPGGRVGGFHPVKGVYGVEVCCSTGRGGSVDRGGAIKDVRCSLGMKPGGITDPWNPSGFGEGNLSDVSSSS